MERALEIVQRLAEILRARHALALDHLAAVKGKPGEIEAIAAVLTEAGKVQAAETCARLFKMEIERQEKERREGI